MLITLTYDNINDETVDAISFSNLEERFPNAINFIHGNYLDENSYQVLISIDGFYENDDYILGEIKNEIIGVSLEVWSLDDKVDIVQS